MDLPNSYEMLSYREKVFVDSYLNQRLIEQVTHRHTYCDNLASFIFAYNREKQAKEAFDIKFVAYDSETREYAVLPYYQEGCKVNITIKNAKKYRNIITAANRAYRKCNKAINDIRYASFETEDKSKMLELKDAIFNSAIHSDEYHDRNDNRKMAMKIFGLDQVKVDTSVDIYEATGRNILQTLKNNNDSDDAPIIPNSIEEVINSEEEHNI